MIEEWRDIVGYSGEYEVSSYGNVRSLTRSVTQISRAGNTYTRTIKGKTVTPTLSTKGDYICVHLSRDNKNKTYNVHRLVAIAFIPNPNNLPQVCHNDGNGKNNHVLNLRWGTHKDNAADKITHGTHRQGEQVPTSVITDENASIVRKRYLAGEYTSFTGLGREFGVSRNVIADIAYGRTFKHIEPVKK